MQVDNFAVVVKGLKPVGEAFGDGKRFVIVRAKNFGVPMQEGGRVVTEVNGDIEDLATQAGDELHFSVGWVLEMHPPHGAAFCAVAVVDLDDGFPAEERGEIARAENAFDIAPLVADRLALYDGEARKRRLNEIKAGVHGVF